jgi:hypothetical protein
MTAIYQQRTADERLLAVTNSVRAWIYPLAAEPVKSGKGKGKAVAAKSAKSKAKAMPRKTEPAAEGFQLRIVG